MNNLEMTADDLRDVLAEKGWGIGVGPDGNPRLTPLQVGTKPKPPSAWLMGELRRLRKAFVVAPSYKSRWSEGGNLVWIEGFPGWIAPEFLAPCSCGEERFWCSKQRVACMRCLLPKPDECVVLEVNMGVLRQQVEASRARRSAG